MITSPVLPKNLEQIFKTENLAELLSALMREIVDILQCDRCFLYLRDPATRLGKAAFCYCRHQEIPNVAGNEWSPELSSSLEEQDPMFAAALSCQPSIFVEDIETATPEKVNRQFEQEHFGHRALIHGHLCHEGKLWGILQPSVFAKPRIWTTSDRQLIKAIAERTTPLVIEYVQQNLNLKEIKHK